MWRARPTNHRCRHMNGTGQNCPTDPQTQRLKKCILLSYWVLWFVMQHYCDDRETDTVLIKAERMDRRRLRGGNVWGCLGMGE